MNVYVAAPFEDSGIVRMVHERFASCGLTPTAKWADQANGGEDFSRFDPARLRAFAHQNDKDVRDADVVLVIARAGAGGEMFAEARIALEWGKAVVWVGRRILSAWRHGVIAAETIDEAIELLVAMQARHVEGHRGQLLTHLVGRVA